MSFTTITIEGIEFEVDYKFIPKEKPSKYDPGEPAQVEFESIKFCGEEFSHLLKNHIIDEIEQKIIKLEEEN